MDPFADHESIQGFKFDDDKQRQAQIHVETDPIQSTGTKIWIYMKGLQIVSVAPDGTTSTMYSQ